MAAPFPGPPPPNVNRGPDLAATAAAVTSVALITVTARIYVRVSMVKCVGKDDYAICAAMLASLVCLAVICASVSNGAGRHSIYIEPEVLMKGLKFNFINQPLMALALGLTKISILLSFLRFTQSRAWRVFIIGLIAFVVSVTIMSVFVICLQCIPIYGLWTPGVNIKCLKPSQLYGLLYFLLVTNIVTDVILAVLPVPIFWNLQIRRRPKAMLIGLMGLGIFASGAAIVKTVLLPSYGKHGDFLWDTVYLTIWAEVEQNVGITAASIPSIKPLFKAFINLYGTGSQLPTRLTNPKLGYMNGESHSMSVVNHRDRSAMNPPKGDGESEDAILGVDEGRGQHRGGGEILKTTVLKITTSDVATDHDVRSKWGPEP